MGFDLYSLGNHKNKNGEYFRNNVWWWRRLADFVCEETGCVEDKDKKSWQHNDGHEVSEEQAKQIASQLKALIKNGKVSEVIKRTEEEIKKTGLAPADYPQADHDTWSWIQSKYSYGSSYPFTMENVEEFIKFCEDSRGFKIC